MVGEGSIFGFGGDLGYGIRGIAWCLGNSFWVEGYWMLEFRLRAGRGKEFEWIWGI